MFGKPFRTPGEYLERWRLFNRMFPDAAVEFVGYSLDSRGNGVLYLKQPLIEGSKRGPEAVAKAMGEKGFVKIAGWEDAYRDPSSGIELWDAKPDNVIFDKAGQVVPIDVWINDPALILGSWDA